MNPRPVGRTALPETDRSTPRRPGDGHRHAAASKPDTIRIGLGHHAVSDGADIMMTTTLGSCVAACIHDPVRGVGGMNHFLLPELPGTERPETRLLGAGARYGSVAMERLINALLALGAERRRLRVKLFGGARVIESSCDIGGLNSRFALDYISREGLMLAGQDLGGDSARRLQYFPHSGRAMRRLLHPDSLSGMMAQERRFMSGLQRRPIEGDVELFDPGLSGGS